MPSKTFSIVCTDEVLRVLLLETHMKTVSHDNEPWRSIELAARTSPAKSLVLDLQNVEYISSAILGKIVGLRRKFSGDIKLINLSPFLDEIFHVTGLNKLFTLARAEAGA
jgi:anti-anti-sigma factor